jgi:hypothetical protein
MSKREIANELHKPVRKMYNRRITSIDVFEWLAVREMKKKICSIEINSRNAEQYDIRCSKKTRLYPNLLNGIDVILQTKDL